MTDDRFTDLDPATLDWEKVGGLLPAIVQHAGTGQVLMLGYMNAEALAATRALGKVTFFSRTKQRLWTKGETSGDTLRLVSIRVDCDRDTLLVLAEPLGPTCHLGTSTCFGDTEPTAEGFLDALERLIRTRRETRPAGSYTTRLFEAGITRIAQKVGEEGVEVALAAATGQPNLADEAANLVYHLLVLLAARDLRLADVVAVLRDRHDPKHSA